MEKQKILIVEDEIDVANALHYTLKGKCDAEIKIALNANEVFTIFETWQPDLLIIDSMMPGMDGFELIKSIKEKAKYHFPIMIISAKDEKEDIEKGYDLGSIEYVVPPFTAEDLIKRVNKVMGWGTEEVNK